jgi:hypothetical protein
MASLLSFLRSAETLSSRILWNCSGISMSKKWTSRGSTMAS